MCRVIKILCFRVWKNCLFGLVCCVERVQYANYSQCKHCKLCFLFLLFQNMRYDPLFGGSGFHIPRVHVPLFPEDSNHKHRTHRPQDTFQRDLSHVVEHYRRGSPAQASTHMWTCEINGTFSILSILTWKEGLDFQCKENLKNKSFKEIMNNKRKPKSPQNAFLFHEQTWFHCLPYL